MFLLCIVTLQYLNNNLIFQKMSYCFRERRSLLCQSSYKCMDFAFAITWSLVVLPASALDVNLSTWKRHIVRHSWSPTAVGWCICMLLHYVFSYCIQYGHWPRNTLRIMRSSLFNWIQYRLVSVIRHNIVRSLLFTSQSPISNFQAGIKFVLKFTFYVVHYNNKIITWYSCDITDHGKMILSLLLRCDLYKVTSAFCLHVRNCRKKTERLEGSYRDRGWGRRRRRDWVGRSWWANAWRD